MHQRLRELFSFFFAQKFHTALCIFYLALGMCCAAGSVYGKVGHMPSDPDESEATNALATYDWNLKQMERPLLNLPDELGAHFDLSPSLSISSLVFPLFQSLEFDAQTDRYTLLLSDTTGRKVEFKSAGTPGRYVSKDSSYVYLSDNRGVITVQACDKTEYTFIRFSDNTTKCIRIKPAAGLIITIVYAKDNLIHSIVDAAGRTIKFNYEGRQVCSISQTWTAASGLLNRTWPVGNNRSQLKLAHASRARIAPVAPVTSVGFAGNKARSMKPVPNNAVTPEYTASMAGSDRQLAAIFGGPGAVAAANGFEPEELGEQYPLYRGDLTAFDGRLLRGHLSYAMHLYGNAEGTGESALFVPAGFTTHSSEPGPTDAAVTFFYPRLGNLTNVTLALFHVAHFAVEGGTSVSPVSGRVRIGSIGGPGGSCAIYKHSHIEFYRGDVGLPSATAREHLRIDPATVFASSSLAATRMRNATPRRSD
ncbi:MAG: hypothetical protein JWM21_4390 [Acidobacteria bacterium]|nr:hypothetical protein [Acidobacteriota bacterium]